MKEKRGSIIKLLRIIGAIFISSFIYFLLIKFTGDKLVEKGYTFDFGFIFNNNQYLTMMLQGYKNTIAIIEKRDDSLILITSYFFHKYDYKIALENII